MEIKTLADKVLQLFNEQEVQTSEFFCPKCKRPDIGNISTDDGRLKCICNQCGEEWFTTDMGTSPNDQTKMVSFNNQ